MSSEASSSAPKRKLRPARKQVKQGEIVHEEEVQTGKEYNIWYNKWAGGEREDYMNNQVHAKTRCIIARDAGYTRADAMGTKYCCIHFARGSCHQGHECKFLHRLPLPSHELPDNALDCFGREKGAEYRDDMSGVGSFSKQNLTLYVGKIHDGARKEDTEETVRRHFGEWGDIARINVLHNRGVAFVTYTTEHQAQFAKEAMSNQSLDGEEVLNVRWATDDPNPVTKIKERKRLKTLGEEGVADALERNRLAIEAVGGVVDEDEAELDRAYAALEELEEQQPAKKARLEGGAIVPGDALENIKFYADLARKQQQQQQAQQKPKVVPGLGALGGYGSGSESD